MMIVVEIGFFVVGGFAADVAGVVVRKDFRRLVVCRGHHGKDQRE